MIKNYLSLVKFSHTVFALPFALVGLMLGFLHTAGTPSWQVAALVLVCMVTARNAAMGFNRWADRAIDARNPRTVIREIPAGKVSSAAALIFVVVNVLGFCTAAGFINRLCFYLSPVALLVVLGYSYTKRFTALCHLVLGVGLALAPIGAYLAVTGQFAWPPVLLGLVVLCWVSGFDIIYALQDEEFDKHYGLNSIPALFGKANALKISRVLHIICASLLSLLLWQLHGGYLQLAATGLFMAALLYQHSLVKPNDLSRVNLAFFTTNGVASLVFGLLTTADILINQGLLTRMQATMIA